MLELLYGNNLPQITQITQKHEKSRGKEEAGKNIQSPERQFPCRALHVATISSGFVRLVLTGRFFMLLNQPMYFKR